MQPLTQPQVQSLAQVSAQLSHVACSNREQLLSFDPRRQSFNRGGSMDEECCKLLDLLVLTEMVIFSLLVHDQTAALCKNFSALSSGRDVAGPAESILMTEELLSRFDSMMISEDSSTCNQRIASHLLTRQDSGIFESVSELVSASLLAYPDAERAAQIVVQLSERIYLKAATSPLTVHTPLANQLLMHLLQSTDFKYHSAMAKALMNIYEALFLELKTLKQDPFKKKVLNKLCNSLSLIVGFSNASTSLELIRHHHEIIKQGKAEMAFLLFTTQDGKLERSQIKANYSEDADGAARIFEEAKAMCETILKRLEKFVTENASRLEKSSSHKFLTLLLSPLE